MSLTPYTADSQKEYKEVKLATSQDKKYAEVSAVMEKSEINNAKKRSFVKKIMPGLKIAPFVLVALLGMNKVSAKEFQPNDFAKFNTVKEAEVVQSFNNLEDKYYKEIIDEITLDDKLTPEYIKDLYNQYQEKKSNNDGTVKENEVFTNTFTIFDNGCIEKHIGIEEYRNNHVTFTKEDITYSPDSRIIIVEKKINTDVKETAYFSIDKEFNAVLTDYHYEDDKSVNNIQFNSRGYDIVLGNYDEHKEIKDIAQLSKNKDDVSFICIYTENNVEHLMSTEITEFEISGNKKKNLFVYDKQTNLLTNEINFSSNQVDLTNNKVAQKDSGKEL